MAGEEEKMTDIIEQFMNLAWMTVFGFLTASFWCLGQKAARKWLKNKIIMAAMEFFSCVLIAVSFLQMLLWVNGGILRNYVVLGCLAGVFLYCKFFHR